jgi:hypothetical protein
LNGLDGTWPKADVVRHRTRLAKLKGLLLKAGPDARYLRPSRAFQKPRRKHSDA